MLVTAPAEKEGFLREIELRGAEVRRQFDLLRPFFTPRTVFLHVGARDCLLALQAASYVERVYAVGTDEGVARGVRLPLNLRFGWPPEGAVDVAFSEQLDEARLPQIRRGLAPGGRYLVLSPKSFLSRLFPRARRVAAVK